MFGFQEGIKKYYSNQINVNEILIIRRQQNTSSQINVNKILIIIY